MGRAIHLIISDFNEEDEMRTVLIIIGIIAFVLISIFLWMLVAGADERRRRKDKNDIDT